ncbi:unnamed protein product [Effrenium voratum]|uniref:Uncharacterized protein n=1 Tax=Effrenium voratum TaxID=2562239 RepID=A0AA36JSM4_9DINO|nr:unnamed protein product [Effrenium voratum]
MDPNYREQRPGTASLAGRELPKDLVQQVSNVNMGQLFYILGHIQKLSAQAPVTAQRILAENPQICQAHRRWSLALGAVWTLNVAVFCQCRAPDFWTAWTIEHVEVQLPWL